MPEPDDAPISGSATLSETSSTSSSSMSKPANSLSSMGFSLARALIVLSFIMDCVSL